MSSKYIKLLSLIPVELVEAENVKSVVIQGITYEISEVIRRAKMEARQLINTNGRVFTSYTKEQLQNILNFY